MTRSRVAARLFTASLPEAVLFDNHGDGDLILSGSGSQERLK
jgi:hypothetical protein